MYSDKALLVWSRWLIFSFRVLFTSNTTVADTVLVSLLVSWRMILKFRYRIRKCSSVEEYTKYGMNTEFVSVALLSKSFVR